MMRRDRGLTLLELVVAVFVLAVGAMAALRAVDQSRLAIGGAEARLLALQVAENRVEARRLESRVGPLGLPGAVSQGGRRFVLDERRRATAGGLVELTVTARAADGGARGGVVLVAYLSGLPPQVR